MTVDKLDESVGAGTVALQGGSVSRCRHSGTAGWFSQWVLAQWHCRVVQSVGAGTVALPGGSVSRCRHSGTAGWFSQWVLAQWHCRVVQSVGAGTVALPGGCTMCIDMGINEIK